MRTFNKGFKWVSIIALTLSCIFSVVSAKEKYIYENLQNQNAIVDAEIPSAPEREKIKKTLQHPEQEKIDYYNQLHEQHAASFNGPELWERITVAPSNGSRDGDVSVNVCSYDSWSSEVSYILLDTSNWWAWGADGWTTHSAGNNNCETFNASVPAGNYLFIIGDSYGDGGATAEVSVNGEVVGTIDSNGCLGGDGGGDCGTSPYSGIYETSLAFDVADVPAADTYTANFSLEGI